MIDRCYIEITNTCNLNCDFCPKHQRKKRQLTAEEFDLLTDKVSGKVCFLYFHLMGEPLLYKSGTPRKKYRTENQDRNNNIRPEKIAYLNKNVLY